MNKVKIRCQKESSAKFHYASVKMFNELKLLRVTLYFLAIIPVVLQLIPKFSENETLSFLYTLISFGLTILTEVLSSFMINHKENAILEYQLYESEITGSTFSKIEYDRESTNELNELGIRKGLPKTRKLDIYNEVYVPDEISDDYSYLYLCRKNAATTNFLLGRIFVIYIIFIILILCGFAGCMFIKKDTSEYLKLIICFYPLILPLIKDCTSCKEAQRGCVKICADIDNFFADGDSSVERLARFYYYAQNIEFEMMNDRPTMYAVFSKLFKRGINILQDGVTYRFIDAINELRIRSSGLVHMPKGKSLITKVDIDIEELERKQKRLKEQQRVKRQESIGKKENTETDTVTVAEKPATTQAHTTATKTTSPTIKATASKPVSKTSTVKAASTAKTTKSSPSTTKASTSKPTSKGSNAKATSKATPTAKATTKSASTAKSATSKPTSKGSAAKASTKTKTTTSNKK